MGLDLDTNWLHCDTPGRDRTMMLEHAEQDGKVDRSAYLAIVAHRDSLLAEINEALNDGRSHDGDPAPNSFEGIKELRKLIGALMRTRNELVAEVRDLRTQRTQARFSLGQTLKRKPIPTGDAGQPLSMADAIKLAEESAIIQALDATEDVKEASKVLGISTQTIYRRMKDFGIPTETGR